MPSVNRNEYPEFSDFEVAIVKKTARQMVGHYGLTKDDIPDLEQELMLHMWKIQRDYDPEHDSRCGFETFITKAIRKKKIDILREKATERRRLDYRRDLLKTYQEEIKEGLPESEIPMRNEQIVWNSVGADYSETVEDQVIAKITREETVKKLTPQQSEIYQMFEAGYTPLEIAGKLGVSKSAVYDQIKAIEARFREAGLFDPFD